MSHRPQSPKSSEYWEEISYQLFQIMVNIRKLYNHLFLATGVVATRIIKGKICQKEKLKNWPY